MPRLRTNILVLPLLLFGADSLRLEASAPTALQELRTSLKHSLVQLAPEGMKPFMWTREPKIVALYFGAGWCAPCREFIPDLRSVYEALRAEGADTELVFMSLDRSAGDMRRTMERAHMPWPALDWRQLPHSPALRALASRGPPNLVLIDRDGRVLASAWDGERYRGPAAVLKTWAEICAKNSPLPTPAPAIFLSPPDTKSRPSP